jgi:hypothetical protein
MKVLVVVVVRAQLEAPLLIPMLALAVTELPQLFLAHLLLMLVAAGAQQRQEQALED